MSKFVITIARTCGSGGSYVAEALEKKLGINIYGQDIFTCLASAARLSFLLAFRVSFINFVLGACYGAIEGYYASAAISGIGMDTAQFMTAVEAVDLSAVVSAAKTLTLQSVYFLRGEK